MFLILLITFLSFWGMIGNTFGQELYKWVDEKGTVHFSDNPTSGVLKSQEKPTFKEDTQKILKGIETGNRHISKDQLILYNQKSTDEDVVGRQLKAIKDQSEELQLRRDRAADMLEKEARKTYVDHKGRALGMTRGQQQMLRDAARLRSGFDFEASPPPEPPSLPPPSPPPPPPHQNPGAINTRTGEFYPGVAGGIINPRTGEFMPEVGGGYIKSRTGEFVPKH
jgi:hypothetical protein